MRESQIVFINQIAEIKVGLNKINNAVENREINQQNNRTIQQSITWESSTQKVNININNSTGTEIELQSRWWDEMDNNRTTYVSEEGGSGSKIRNYIADLTFHKFENYRRKLEQWTNIKINLTNLMPKDRFDCIITGNIESLEELNFPLHIIIGGMVGINIVASLTSIRARITDIYKKLANKKAKENVHKSLPTTNQMEQEMTTI